MSGVADAPGFQHHEGGEALPELLVIDADSGRLRHGGVGIRENP
jgi:hypothetical protein